MYITQVRTIQNDWWRYILGVVISFIGVAIFSAPHAIAIVFKQFSGDFDTSRADDLNYLMTVFEPNINLVLVLLPFAGGLLFLILAAKWLHQQSLRHLTTARAKIDWNRVLFAFLLWGTVAASLIFVGIYLTPEDYVFNFKPEKFAILVVIVLLLVPLQTSFEEYMFRGYLMQGIGFIFKNKWLPLLVTSVVFGLLHIANPEVDKLGNLIMIYYIGTGLFLGIITLMDDGMELALGFHAANNMFTALLVTADWTAFQTHSMYRDISEPDPTGFFDIFLPVFIIFPIILFIFAKKYKWTNWKEKLTGTIHIENTTE
ncbi:CPBP family intramembrane glutamic endopeptidase [Paucihalobacter sp.]|uniref:CPBP family intramembrane glutamic endopeptidase n=1 Tax=Paucihalobacter sp. TaxID=2850405 RepID=UPI002FE206FD